MMKTRDILLILLLIFTVQVNSQTRKWISKGKTKAIKFEFKPGVQKLIIPGTRSFLTVEIRGRVPKIVNLSSTSNGKTYKLKRVDRSTCLMKCTCNVDCWINPVTKQYIGICKPCSGDDDEINGQIEFLGPD
jgi:hypothetical protein